jgi:hypothetical protein
MAEGGLCRSPYVVLARIHRFQDGTWGRPGTPSIKLAVPHVLARMSDSIQRRNNPLNRSSWMFRIYLELVRSSGIEPLYSGL